MKTLSGTWMKSAFLSRNNHHTPLLIMTNFFIAGTDIGVGKTYVACCLLRDLKQRGIQAGPFKPICCGDRAEARLLREAAGISNSLEQLNPLYLRTCADPAIAAGLERKEVSLPVLVESYRQIDACYSPVLVDSMGGWETPLNKENTMADLAAYLQLPVILVVKNQRGAASQAMMAVRAIRERALECRAIILNHIGEEWDTASVTNRQLIEDCTGVPVAAELIHGQEDIDSESVLGY